MNVEKKESYRARIKKVEADLIRFGISSGLTKKLTYSYSLGVLERLIKATEKRRPGEPATYFLNGLKKSTMKHRLQHGSIEAEDID
jgi:hypothetical protein